MFLGRVAGTVWSTVKWPQAQGLKLLLVRPYRLGDLRGALAREAAPRAQRAVGADRRSGGLRGHARRRARRRRASWRSVTRRASR